MRIEKYADFICPWCYIGLKRLKDIMADNPDTKFELTLRNFVLNPNLPPEGIDYRSFLADKLGKKEAVEKALDKITATGKELGLTYRFEKGVYIFNTFHAHRLVKKASPERQEAVIEKIFQAIFTENRKLGIISGLIKLGSELKLGSESELISFFEGDEYKEEVNKENEASYKMPMITIPFLMLDGKYPVQGAHLPGITDHCIRNLI